jgi:hypothetical protein
LVAKNEAWLPARRCRSGCGWVPREIGRAGRQWPAGAGLYEDLRDDEPGHLGVG